MNYIKIDTEDVCNGDGLRVVLWLSGCTHNCYNCQNPQTWDADRGILFDELAKEELFRELNKDYISGLTLTGGDPLHEANLDDVLNLVNEIRLSFGDTKTIWLYTGYTWEEIITLTVSTDNTQHFDKTGENSYIFYDNHKKNIEKSIMWDKRHKILTKCDILIDGKYIDSQRDITLKWRGSSNQRIWKNVNGIWQNITNSI